jgi:2-oxoglutarate dehydrogenase E2 component (dihydrolipoamide succinyltransferase)
MIEVVMPQLGESVAEGTVTKWLVREGDYVTRDQNLLEVATDKADTEIPAPAAGVVVSLAVPVGTVVAKQGLLCTIDETAQKPAEKPAEKAAEKPVEKAAEKPAEKPVEAPRAETEAKPSSANGETAQATPSGAPFSAGAPLTTPSTRKLAHEMGVDITRVQATGDRGRVTRDDVVRAVGQSSPPPPMPTEARAPAQSSHTAELSQLIQAGGGFVPPIPGVGYGAYKVPAYVQKPGDEVIPFNRRRRITADHMVYSKATSPHVVTVAEVDIHLTSKLRDEHKDKFKKSGVPLTFLSFICAATVKALREHPQVNARVLDNSFAILRDVNLGVAVDTPGGLIVPSIKNADRLSLRGIAQSIDELAGRARSGKITADDLANTTFTVSNPGLKGNLFGGAIISQPNAGILRMGEIKKRVVVVTQNGEDSIAIHPVMYIAFSYDHRIIDGVLANSFLWRVGDILSRAEFEVS